MNVLDGGEVADDVDRTRRQTLHVDVRVVEAGHEYAALQIDLRLRGVLLHDIFAADGENLAVLHDDSGTDREIVVHGENLAVVQDHVGGFGLRTPLQQGSGNECCDGSGPVLLHG